MIFYSGPNSETARALYSLQPPAGIFGKRGNFRLRVTFEKTLYQILSLILRPGELINLII